MGSMFHYLCCCFGNEGYGPIIHPSTDEVQRTDGTAIPKENVNTEVDSVDIPKTTTETKYKLVSPVINDPTTRNPTTQAELLAILQEVQSSALDDCGNVRLAPSLDHWYDMTEDLPVFNEDRSGYNIETCTLGSVLYRSTLTTVYKINNHPKLIVRYHLHEHCKSRPVDTSLVDYWFLRRLQHTGLVPKVYYYSGPLDPNTDYDSSGYIAPAKRAKDGKTCTSRCSGKINMTSVRYTILEKTHMSLDHLIRHTAPSDGILKDFSTSIRLGGQMIGLLERLHALNYIHGDIHTGNFVFKNGKQLILIDFGLSRVISDTELVDEAGKDFIVEMRYGQKYMYHTIVSPWETQGYMLSYRDDIYRALLCMIRCIYGYAYSAYLEYLIDRVHPPGLEIALRARFVDLKLHGTAIEIPFNAHAEGSFHTFPSRIKTEFTLQGLVPDEVLSKVQHLLTDMMRDLLSCDIYTKPDYTKIKETLAKVLWIVANPAAVAKSKDGEVFHGSFAGFTAVDWDKCFDANYSFIT